MRSWLKPLSWLVGVSLVGAVIVYVGPQQILALFTSIGLSGVIAWSAMTIAARVVQVETTVAPLSALGFSVRRRDMFWIGWLRTFANQVVPAAGIVAYTQALRRKIDISWSELAAMATPQFVLAAAALGLLGIAAVVSNLGSMKNFDLPLLGIYGLTLIVALLLVRGAHGLFRFLPSSAERKLEATSEALQRISSKPRVLATVVASHAGAILLRGFRLWLLIVAAGFPMSWSEALLVAAIAESSMLMQLTPGGLGIREGAVVAGAMLVGVPAETAAGIAVIDRILMVAIIALLTPPSVLVLSRDVSRD